MNLNVPRASVRDFSKMRSCRLYSTTVAPICGMPDASVTTPAMAPESLNGLVAGSAEGAVRHTIPTATPKTSQPTGLFAFVLNIGFVLQHPRCSYKIRCSYRTDRHPLLLDYRKFGGWGEHLVSIFIGYFQPDGVLPRNQCTQGKKFFNCYLVGGRPWDLRNLFGHGEDRLIRAGLDHLVRHLAGGYPGFSIGAEIIDLQVDTHLFIALEDLIHTRSDLGCADHELAGADALGGDLFDLIRQYDGTSRELFGVDSRNYQRYFLGKKVAAGHVLGRHAQPVGARCQRNRLVINRLALRHLLQVFLRAGHRDRVFEVGHDAPGQSAHLAENVDRRHLDAFFVAELEVLVFELHGYRSQHRSVGKREEIHPVPGRQHVVADLGIDGGFQVVELDGGRALQFGELLDMVEFVHLLRLRPEGDAQMGAVGAVEAVGLARHAHLFHQGEAGVGDVEQGVFLGRVAGHAILARHGGVDEFNIDVGANALDIAVAPLLEGEGGGGAAAFFRRPLVGAAGRVGFLLVGRAVGDVDAAAVRLPAGNSRSEVLVGVGDAAVVFFLKLVFHGVRGGIAAQPEIFDERLALLVGLETLERGALLIGDDVRHIFVEPLAVGGFELFAEFFVAAALF